MIKIIWIFINNTINKYINYIYYKYYTIHVLYQWDKTEICHIDKAVLYDKTKVVTLWQTNII